MLLLVSFPPRGISEMMESIGVQDNIIVKERASDRPLGIVDLSCFLFLVLKIRFLHFSKPKKLSSGCKGSCCSSRYRNVFLAQQKPPGHMTCAKQLSVSFQHAMNSVR